MPAIRIRTTVESDTLTLPELRPLIGKDVEIRVVERKPGRVERLKDRAYHAACEADGGPAATLDEARAILSRLPDSLSAQIIADREERV